MTPRVEPLAAAHVPVWDAYVEAHPDASLYHLAAWRQVLADAFGSRSHYLAAWQGERLCGVLPLVATRGLRLERALVSIPFFNYGGVLADDAESERALVDAAIGVARQVGAARLELRHAVKRDLGLAERSHKVTLRLDLPATRETLWDALPAKLRSQVRRPEKAGMTAQVGGPEELGAFYRVFAERMHDLGTPVYPRRFFGALFRRFPAAARVAVVRLGAEPVAAGVLLRWRDTLELPWAAACRRHNPAAPNMLLYWTALAEACELGCRRFDFGRSTPESPTHRFKTQWGAEPAPLHWHHWHRDGEAPPAHHADSRLLRAAARVWRRLPLPVANILGPRLAPYAPW